MTTTDDDAPVTDFTLRDGDFSGEHRYRVLSMKPELLFCLRFNCLSARDRDCFNEVRTLAVEGLPEDVRIESLAYVPRTGDVLLRLWSSKWPLVTGDPPLLRWGHDVLFAERRMFLLPYTACDLLSLVNEARSRQGLEHVDLAAAEAPVRLRDLLVLDEDLKLRKGENDGRHQIDDQG